jgi:hypothetical protein
LGNRTQTRLFTRRKIPAQKSRIRNAKQIQHGLGTPARVFLLIFGFFALLLFETKTDILNLNQNFYVYAKEIKKRTDAGIVPARPFSLYFLCLHYGISVVHSWGNGSVELCLFRLTIGPHNCNLFMDCSRIVEQMKT